MVSLAMQSAQVEMKRQRQLTTSMKNEEATVHMRENNPNIASFFFILLAPNIWSFNFYVPPNKGVGPYN